MGKIGNKKACKVRHSLSTMPQKALLCKSALRIFVPEGLFKHGWTIIFEAASLMLVDKWRIQ